MTLEENEQLVRRAYEQVWGGYADEFLAENYVDHNARMGMPPDRDGLKKVVQSIRTAFPDFTVTMKEVIAAGDKVAVPSTHRGTHMGLLMGSLPPVRQ